MHHLADGADGVDDDRVVERHVVLRPGVVEVGSGGAQHDHLHPVRRRPAIREAPRLHAQAERCPPVGHDRRRRAPGRRPSQTALGSPKSVNSGSLVQTMALESAAGEHPVDRSGVAGPGAVAADPRQRDEVRPVVVDQLRLVDEGPNVEQRAGGGGLGDLGAGEEVDVGAPFVGRRLRTDDTWKGTRWKRTRSPYFSPMASRLACNSPPSSGLSRDTDDDFGLVERNGIGVGVGAVEVLDAGQGRGRRAAGRIRRTGGTPRR